MSPAPQVTTAPEAMDYAGRYVREHPGSDFAVGRGDSMVPLYRDRDVIILSRPALADLQAGQTVVFVGEDGVPVAHILVCRTTRGLVTCGLNNEACDPGILRDCAYIGVVVKAFRPTRSVILACNGISPPRGR